MVKGVIEVTGRIEMQIVGDRLFVTVPSGERATTYAVPFFLAREAIAESWRILDAAERTGKVCKFPRRPPH